MEQKKDSTGTVEYVSKYPVVFPVMHFDLMCMTLDGKKEIPGDVAKYVRHIEKAEDLSAEEVMYLVKRVGDLEDALKKLIDLCRNYE